MFNRASLLYLHALTAVHAGSGSELGLIDLPIQREKHTSYPKIESSSLKGALRAVVADVSQDMGSVDAVFGKESGNGDNDAVAGAVAFADAKVLLFPVRSLRGVFAWVSCPQVLNRFKAELEIYMPEMASFEVPEANTISGSKLIVNPGKKPAKVVLEEYTFEIKEDESCQKLGKWLNEAIFSGHGPGLLDRVMVLEDDDFVDFVTLSTEVNARIRIDSQTGTVKDGALWYEENVPPETVFYSFCFAGDSRIPDAPKKADEILAFLQDEKNLPAYFQLGGNSTLGKGILRRIWR